MKEYTTLNFHHGALRFCAGHFTIFSATKRERLHGHNYTLEASVVAAIDEPGITFDYRLFENKLHALCHKLHTYFLLPGQSPYLQIIDKEEFYHAIFDGKVIPFLKEDVLILPIENVTLEALSKWFVEELTKEKTFMVEHDIKEVRVRVFNGPVHSADAGWVA